MWPPCRGQPPRPGPAPGRGLEPAAHPQRQPVVPAPCSAGGGGLSAAGHRPPAVRCRAGPGGYSGRGSRKSSPRPPPRPGHLPRHEREGRAGPHRGQAEHGHVAGEGEKPPARPRARPARPVAVGPPLSSPPCRARGGGGGGGRRVLGKRPGGSTERGRAWGAGGSRDCRRQAWPVAPDSGRPRFPSRGRGGRASSDAWRLPG